MQGSSFNMVKRGILRFLRSLGHGSQARPLPLRRTLFYTYHIQIFFGQLLQARKIFF